MATLPNNLLVRVLKSPEFDFVGNQGKKNEAALLNRVRKLTKEQREEVSAALDEIVARIKPGAPASPTPLTERGVVVLLLTNDEKVGFDKEYETSLPDFIAKIKDALSNASLMEKISETRASVLSAAAHAASRPAPAAPVASPAPAAPVASPAPAAPVASPSVPAIIPGDDTDIRETLKKTKEDLAAALEQRKNAYIPQQKLENLNKLLSESERLFKAMNWEDLSTSFELNEVLRALKSAIEGLESNLDQLLYVLRLSQTEFKDLETELGIGKAGLNPQEIKEFFLDSEKAFRGKTGKDLVIGLITRFFYKKLNSMKKTISDIESKQKLDIEKTESIIQVLERRLSLYILRRAEIEGRASLEKNRAELKKAELFCSLIDKMLQQKPATIQDAMKVIDSAKGAIPVSDQSLPARFLQWHFEYLKNAQAPPPPQSQAQNGDNTAAEILKKVFPEFGALRDRVEESATLDEFIADSKKLNTEFDEQKKLKYIKAHIQYLKAVFENQKMNLQKAIPPVEQPPQPHASVAGSAPAPVASAPPVLTSPNLAATPQSAAPAPVASAPAVLTSPNLAPAPQSAAPAPVASAPAVLTSPNIAPAASQQAAAPAAQPKPVKKGPFVIERDGNVKPGQISKLESVIKYFKEAVSNKKSPQGCYQQINFDNCGALSGQIFGAFNQILMKNKKMAGPVFGEQDENAGKSKDLEFGKTVFELPQGGLYKDIEGKFHSIASFDELNSYRLKAIEDVLKVYQ